jgi:hypothetical protein
MNTLFKKLKDKSSVARFVRAVPLNSQTTGGDPLMILRKIFSRIYSIIKFEQNSSIRFKSTSLFNAFNIPRKTCQN